jgi:hypothetical protein
MMDCWAGRGSIAIQWRTAYGKLQPGEWILVTIKGRIERLTIVRVSPLGFYETVTCDGDMYTVNCDGIDPNEVL